MTSKLIKPINIINVSHLLGQGQTYALVEELIKQINDRLEDIGEYIETLKQDNNLTIKRKSV